MNIKLIRESFDAIKPHADDVMKHFYSELFNRYPQSRALFNPEKIKQQRLMLSNALAHIVEYLEEQDHLQDYLKKMGARHIRYKVQEEYFPWVGEALIATFKFYFENQWTPELQKSWTELYGFITHYMLEGMKGAMEQSTKPQVIESSVHVVARTEPPLEELARDLARNLFKKALEEEVAMFGALAQEKAREILRRALEQEAQNLLQSIKKQAS